MTKAAKSDKDARRDKVIEVLNKARAMELYAISQYMIHHYALDAMDYGELAKNMKLVAIDEMRHAEQFAERIKELGGEPGTDLSDKVQMGQDVPKIFDFDAVVEDVTIDAYNQWLSVCREMGDNVSVKLFEAIIDEEQTHFNHFENVSSHIVRLGDAYLSKIAGTPSSTGAASKGFVLAGGGGE